MSLLEGDPSEVDLHTMFASRIISPCCSQEQRNDMLGKMREPGGHTMYISIHDYPCISICHQLPRMVVQNGLRTFLFK